MHPTIGILEMMRLSQAQDLHHLLHIHRLDQVLILCKNTRIHFEPKNKIKIEFCFSIFLALRDDAKNVCFSTIAI